MYEVGTESLQTLKSLHAQVKVSNLESSLPGGNEMCSVQYVASTQGVSTARSPITAIHNVSQDNQWVTFHCTASLVYS